MDWNRPLVCYPWMIKMLGGDVTAAYLLNQMVYWHVKMTSKGRYSFYKFIDPPDGDPVTRYEDGDSWTEELQISSKQFARARDVIATRSDHPLSQLTSKVDAHGRILPISHLVMYYWQPSRHRMEWTVNLPLLYFYNELFCEEVYTVGTLDIQGFENPAKVGGCFRTTQMGSSEPPKWVVPIAENTTEITAEEKTNAREPLAVEVGRLHFGLEEDAFWSPKLEAEIDQRVAILERVGIAAKDVPGFKAWYVRTVKVSNLPSDPAKFEKHYRDYKLFLTAGQREAQESIDRQTRRASMVVS